MNNMKKGLLLFAVGASFATFAQAANAPQPGTIISESSVNCGSKEAGHKKSVDLVCQEYVVRSTTIDYHVRQEKPSDQALVPVNTEIQFIIDKDKIKFKVDGKSYEYVVVSEAAIGAAPTPQP